MLEWIKMNLPTLIGSAIIAGVFIAIVYHEIKKRRKGLGGCSCGCGGCAAEGLCHCDKETSEAQRIQHQ